LEPKIDDWRLGELAIRTIASFGVDADDRRHCPSVYEFIEMTFGRDKLSKTGPYRDELLALRAGDPEQVRQFVLKLAKQYDGQDRFYLAAIGIAVGTDPKRREIILADFEKQFPEWTDKVADLVWELRPPSVMPKLAERLNDAKIPPAQRARIVDILATSGEKDAGRTMLKVLQSDLPGEVKNRAIENLRLFLPGKWAGLAKSSDFKAAVDQLLENSKSQSVALKLVAAARFTSAIGPVAKLADTGNIEAIHTLGQLPSIAAVDELEKLYWRIVRAGEPNRTGNAEAVAALGTQAGGPADSPATKRALIALQKFITPSDALIDAQKSALVGLAASRAGTQWLIQLKEKNQLPPELVSEAGRLLRNSPFQGLRNRAMIAFPIIAKLDIAKLPSLSILAARRGDVERGKQIMLASLKGDSQCMKCHAVRGVGGNVGPDLATIGTKASRENLFESILYPSKAIADQFVQWNVTTTRGVAVSGLMIEDKPDHLLLRDANGKDIRIERRDVSEKDKNPKSIMPDDIARTLTESELVDLVEYLVTLQTGSVK
jgi:putative heme-binding domain-containing protein